MVKIPSKKIQISVKKVNPRLGAVLLLVVFGLWSVFLISLTKKNTPETNQLGVNNPDSNNTLLSNAGYQGEPTVVVDEPITSALAPATNEASVGEVLGKVDCSAASYWYDTQPVCSQNGFSRTACEEYSEEQALESGVSGICVNEYVEMELVEVWYPRILFLGSNYAGIPDNKVGEYMKADTVQFPWDEKNSRYLQNNKGFLGAYSLSGGGGTMGGGPDNVTRTSLKVASPVPYAEGIPGSSQWLTQLFESDTSKDINMTINIATRIPASQSAFGRFKDKINGTIGDVLWLVKAKLFDLTREPNSPVVANKLNKELQNPLAAPNQAILDRSFESNSCSESAAKKDVLTYMSPESGRAGRIECLVPVLPAVTFDLSTRGHWLECTLNPKSENCQYSVTNEVLIDGPWGSTAECNNETCSLMSADLKISSLMAPNADIINFDESVQNPGNPAVKPTYVKTLGKMKVTDNSKLTGKVSYATVYVLWEIPHAKELMAWCLEATPGICPDTYDPEFFERALLETEQSYGAEIKVN